MKNSEKHEFLDFAQDLARNLESVTDEFSEVLIGFMHGDFGGLPVTIMVNHNEKWFGSWEGGINDIGWNSNVIYNNIKEFEPVNNDYLALNELIEKAYRRN